MVFTCISMWLRYTNRAENVETVGELVFISVLLPEIKLSDHITCTDYIHV